MKNVELNRDAMSLLSRKSPLQMMIDSSLFTQIGSVKIVFFVRLHFSFILKNIVIILG